MGRKTSEGQVERLPKKEYAERLEALQLRLNTVERWLQHTGQRVVVVVEGRDTAGKGGVIHAISEHMNPRQCHVVALGKPSERERSQWYFQRYVPHLPAAGEIVLFDRSWYNRAGCEHVMGCCTKEQHAEFMQSVPKFEEMLVGSGIKLLKYYLDVSKAEQAKRLEERRKELDRLAARIEAVAATPRPVGGFIRLSRLDTSDAREPLCLGLAGGRLALLSLTAETVQVTAPADGTAVRDAGTAKAAVEVLLAGADPKARRVELIVWQGAFREAKLVEQALIEAGFAINAIPVEAGKALGAGTSGSQ